MFNPRQTGEILSRGLEFETIAQLADGLDLIGAYTWLPEFTITESSDPIEVGKREPIVPEHMASLWMHYKFGRGSFKGFGFGGGVRYIGETFGDIINSELMVVPDITLFDAAIDYEVGGWRFAVNAKNLEDKTYVASCWDTCYYGAGRSVIGSIRRRW
jgi:iron complex outermembrane receptor protein